jgi:hypothetical protein
MKDKETINSSRAILLIKVANELFKLRKYETMKINSISLSKIDEQYNFNNFEMNFQNPIEIGKSMTGISRSYFNVNNKKEKQNTREREKKYSYKRPKFLYRIGMNSSNILNIINQINDIDLNKIRKRKVISEAKFKEIETPSTNNNIFDSQEKTLLEEQALNYLRDLAKNLKDITQCRNNRKSMKSSKTVRLNFYDKEINEKIKNTKNEKIRSQIKAKSNENIIELIKPSKFKSSSQNTNNYNINQLNMNRYNVVYVSNFNENKVESIMFQSENENKKENVKEENNEETYLKKNFSKKKSIVFLLPEEKEEDENILK